MAKDNIHHHPDYVKIVRLAFIPQVRKILNAKNVGLGRLIQQDILICGAGSYITVNKTACSVCYVGQYQDEDDQSSCKPCDTGKYNDFSGRISICKDDCGAGSYITDFFDSVGG